MTRADVVSEARQWIGTPYRHGQRVKGKGADCIGLLGGVALELGMPSGREWAADPALKGYGPDPDPEMLLAACARYLVPIVEPRAGDILLFRFEREPHHFAIIVHTCPTRIVHSYVSARKVAENGIDGNWRQDQTWRSLIVGAWRYRELAD